MSTVVVCNAQGARIEAESDWLAALARTLGREPQVFAAPDPSTAPDADPAGTSADVVWLEFPAFANGRHYSTAARLVKSGFRGVVAATGEAVCADQVGMMRDCGITVFRARRPDDAPLLTQHLALKGMRRFDAR